MEKTIIKYASFKNNEEFTTWQREEKRVIHQISPVAQDVSFTQDSQRGASSESSEGAIGLSFGVFVVYVEYETE
jgi:hypothetical protein